MKLYKYLHPDRVDVIRNRCLRFSQPSALNDPFDVRPAYVLPHSLRRHIEVQADMAHQDGLLESFVKYHPGSSAEERMDHLAAWGEGEGINGSMDLRHEMVVRPWIEEAHRMLLSRIDASIGVCCFTERPDNLLMWSHYADNHRGLALGFEFKAPFGRIRRNGESPIGRLSPVCYDPERPFVVIGADDYKVEDVLLTKGKEWEYEKEWRMFRLLEKASARIETKDLPVCLFEFPARHLREVHLGAAMPEATVEAICSLVWESKDLSHAKIFKREASLYFFEVEANEVRRGAARQIARRRRFEELYRKPVENLVHQWATPMLKGRRRK